jgi:hypothetical protein
LCGPSVDIYSQIIHCAAARASPRPRPIVCARSCRPSSSADDRIRARRSAHIGARRVCRLQAQEVADCGTTIVKLVLGEQQGWRCATFATAPRLQMPRRQTSPRQSPSAGHGPPESDRPRDMNGVADAANKRRRTVFGADQFMRTLKSFGQPTLCQAGPGGRCSFALHFAGAARLASHRICQLSKSLPPGRV